LEFVKRSAKVFYNDDFMRHPVYFPNSFQNYQQKSTDISIGFMKSLSERL